MNSDTGHIKKFEDLTEEEKLSGKWKELNGLEGVAFPASRPMSKSDMKRELYMAQVRAKEALKRQEAEAAIAAEDADREMGIETYEK